MVFRSSSENLGGTAGRDFKPSVGCLPVLLWSSKICQKDRLEEGFHKVESALIAGVPSLEKTTGACMPRAGLYARPLALGA